MFDILKKCCSVLVEYMMSSNSFLVLKFSNKIAGQSVVDKFLEWTAKYPRMYVLWFGPFDARVVLNHPDPIKRILKTSGKHMTRASDQ